MPLEWIRIELELCCPLRLFMIEIAEMVLDQSTLLSINRCFIHCFFQLSHFKLLTTHARRESTHSIVVT
jgi:hypothetical protein